MTRYHNHELRLERTLHHLQDLEAEDRRWREGHPYNIAYEPDPQTGEKFIRVEVLEQPPASIRLIIGDCVHNLSSALDNLAYALAEAYSGSPLPAQVA